jgi:hypothetical protein
MQPTGDSRGEEAPLLGSSGNFAALKLELNPNRIEESSLEGKAELLLVNSLCSPWNLSCIRTMTMSNYT